VFPLLLSLWVKQINKILKKKNYSV